MFLNDYGWQIESYNYRTYTYESKPLEKITDLEIVKIGLASETRISKHRKKILNFNMGFLSGYDLNGSMILSKQYTGRNYHIPLRDVVVRCLKEMGQLPEFLC